MSLKSTSQFFIFSSLKLLSWEHNTFYLYSLLAWTVLRKIRGLGPTTDYLSLNNAPHTRITALHYCTVSKYKIYLIKKSYTYHKHTSRTEPIPSFGSSFVGLLLSHSSILTKQIFTDSELWQYITVLHEEMSSKQPYFSLHQSIMKVLF